ncbi:protein Jumonji-like isoform X1 [Littorina saxatilis]|uniref:protein Jumonji-like isoform X1 n=1 Tax=Littorina saxatilis TaxID=31220 RepID=UPI0038B476A0
MVSRRSTQSVTQRSTRQSELHMTRRPRRLVAPKTVDDAVGLSRKEERELKKALYASLQESRRARTPLPEEDNEASKEMPKLRKSTRHINPSSLHCARIHGSVHGSIPSASMDESSQDSVVSSVPSSHGSKKKVHAQRKFAQGCSLPSTPNNSPGKKAANASHSLLDRVPKTEDFLTFLCLRGSHLLPPNLDFFNFARDESALEEEINSRQRTPVTSEQGVTNDQTRESTPESSSSGSNVNEELMEFTTPLSTTSRLAAAVSMKAARASAGTPDTARGIVSLRQGLTRKVVHRGSTPPSQHSRKYLYTPDKTPSPSGARLMFGNFTPAKKSASIKCLPASFLRFSPSGKLALQRNGNSPRLTPNRSPVAPSPRGSKGENGRGHGQRQRVPADAFKSVGRTQTRVKKDKRNASSNASPVRKILEGASKKLRKSQSSDMLRRPKKDEKQMRVRSREDRLKKRSREDPRRRQGSKKTEAKKPHRAASRPLPTKAKRRSSVRLKTLAKILGRKRPNYSLVASGYADMEEYEEEQKKKAAKSALTKAKAEARARASVRNAAAVAVRKRRVKEPEKMRTRSSSVTTKEPEDRHQGDREKDRHLGDRERTEEKRQGDRVEERRAGDRERTGAGPLKRSLSTSSTEKKEQNTLASVVETKRLKKEGGAGREGEGGGTRQPVARETVRKVLPATPPQPKKVTPKKVTPEKPSFASSSSPDPGLSHLEKVPTFYPTEDEFSDPISYIDSIREKAEWCGMCCIIPPQSWKMESKINEEIRFTTQVQHLHRLYSRWGISVEQTRAIVHHLSDITSNHNSLSTPQIGGVEVDLPQLYRMIRDLGGLQNIVDKKQWVKVADAMKIPKAAHDRVTRLYDVYCKFVLPYAMLSETEREQAQKDVHTHYELSSAEEDAIFKGKSMTLGTFSRISRNVQSMWFREDPTPEMVETTLWKIVQDCKSHVSVQCAHVNTRTQSTAFPMRRESPYYRHSWNLNNLPDNKKCILKCLGPVSGTTIPTLHVGMLFSASCWSTDPHRLPYVQYLHSGANTIWYCIPKSDAEKFHEAMRELCPTLIHNDPLWLSEDTAMVNPDHLKAKGVRVTRCVQQPRQFVVVFPDVHTATVCCGYNVSESVHYATTEWLSSSMEAAKALCVSREKELFSVDTLVCGLCQDSNDIDTLTAALPLLQSIVMREIEERRQLSAAGLKCERRLAVEDSPGMSSSVARKRSHDLAEDSACEVCYKICYLSMVLNEHDEQILCLEHGLRHVQRKRHVKAAKLFYRYTEEELTELVQMTKERLASLSANGNGLAKKRTLKKQDSRS